MQSWIRFPYTLIGCLLCIAIARELQRRAKDPSSNDDAIREPLTIGWLVVLEQLEHEGRLWAEFGHDSIAYQLML